MTAPFYVALHLLQFFFAAPLNSYQSKDDGQIRVTFLQLNDMYEIAPVDNGRSGGIARVATLRKEMKKTNPNTYTLLAGDFLSPSAMGTVETTGKRIMGLQMVEALNSAGIDLVTFGNHEFDLKENELTDRINKSKFNWIGSNVKHITPNGSELFTKTTNGVDKEIPATQLLRFTDADGTHVTIGVFALTINSTITDYVAYDDYVTTAAGALKQVRGKCDFVVALTHLPLAEDKKLAARFPEIKLIIGGHEHKNSYTRVGGTCIAKADANARTVYEHDLRYNTHTRRLSISSKLIVVNEAIAEDTATQQVVYRWNKLVDSTWRSQGFNPCQNIAALTEPLDGTEEKVRYDTTNLTKLIARAFSAATKKDSTIASVYNSGSIRIDDWIRDNVSQYDIIRTLPYKGKIVVAEMKGSLLDSLLTISDSSKGNGCFLQSDNIVKSNAGRWLINGKSINADTTYRLAVNDYLVSGRQERMLFLKQGYPGLLLHAPAANDVLRNDIRMAVIQYLQNTAAAPAAVQSSSFVPCY